MGKQKVGVEKEKDFGKVYIIIKICNIYIHVRALDNLPLGTWHAMKSTMFTKKVGPAN